MKRSLLQKAAGLIMPLHVLSIDTECPDISLLSDGTLSAAIPNLRRETRRLISQSVLGVDDDLAGEWSRLIGTEKQLEAMRLVIRLNEESLLRALASGRGLHEPSDLSRLFSASITSNRIAVFVPSDLREDLQDLITRTGAEDHSHVNDIVVLARSSVSTDALLDEAEVLNRDRYIMIERAETARRREEIWQSQVKKANNVPFLAVEGDAMLYETDARARDSHNHLLKIGATERPDGLIEVPKGLFEDNTISVSRISDDHRKGIIEHERKMVKSALRDLGIDASDDPGWAMRRMNGDVTFVVPNRADGLIGMLLEHGAEMQDAKGVGQVAVLSHDEFYGIKTLWPIIRSEVVHVEQGGAGDIASMERRIRSSAEKEARSRTKIAMSSARKSRTKGSLAIDRTSDFSSDLLNPANPIGLLQMQMWMTEASDRGIRLEAAACGARIEQSSGGGIAIDPPSGSSWTDNSSSSSSDSGYSSSYDSGSSSSCGSSSD